MTSISTRISSPKQMYLTVEFDLWAYKQELLPEEKFMIGTYLDKNLKTVDAGTGGGRLASYMQKLGFKNLYGFDYVPEFIEVARKRDTTGSISFTVEDATNLTYNDCEFDQVVYLQQIICSIEDEVGRLNAFKEAYRILKKDGTAIFSFLNFDAQDRKLFCRPYLAYISLLRKLRNHKLPIQYIPRLKFANKMNFGSLLDRPPYLYWYRLEEAYQILKQANFEIVALGSDFQAIEGRMCRYLENLRQEPIEGMLYFVCKK
ncbi:MAG: class I SAM-dependent methyltransferase [Calothrix sp. MO_192.B10]|nr:class I SAM-dependent methyltransferase [Calothrix sp. MO_192.B10]